MPLPPSETPPDEIRERAEEILSRPEFQEPPRTLLQRITDFIGDLISEALDALLGGGRSGWVGWVILVVAVAAVGVFAFRLLRGVTVDPSARLEDPMAGRRRPVEDWVREAEEHEAAGHLRDALRCRYRAAVAELARRGFVEEIPGRTAGEYRVQVAASVPDAAGDFGAATELFELAWYGDAPVDAGDVARLRSLTDRVLGMVPA